MPPIPLILAQTLAGLAAAVALAVTLLLPSTPARAQTSCVAPQVPLNAECVTPAAKCAARGWSHSAENQNDPGICSVNIWENGGANSGFCDLQPNGSCYDAFGPDLNFPQNPGGIERHYVYNCDPDSTRGLIPATHNSGGNSPETDCRCAVARQIRVGATTSPVQINGAFPLIGGTCQCPDGESTVQRGAETVCLTLDQQKTPIITRAISADFASETFTFHWRAPENFGETILGYHIRRQQNDAQNLLSQNHHPADCDDLTDAQYRWSDGAATARTDYPFLTGGITVAATVFTRAEQPSTTGASRGNCYRWHITAFSSARAGPSAATNPILSRSNAARSGCNEGSAKPWAQTSPYSGSCVNQDRLQGLDWCARIGGTVAAGNTQCQIPANASCQDGGYAEASASVCALSSSGGLCQTNERYNLDHRQCACLGWATPADDGNGCECTVGNANNLCECNLGSVYSPETNSCECPANLNPVSDTAGGDPTICVPDAPAQVAQKCRDAGWDIMVSGGTFGAFCSVPYRIHGETSNSGRSGAECLIHGTSTSHPSCEDIFGNPVNFPKASENPNVVYGDANTDRFVANCDLHGAAPGGIPAAEITGATECQCDEFSTPNAAWPNCRPALVDYDYLKHHCPFGGDFPRQEQGGYEAYRTTAAAVIGAICFFAGFPNARGCIGVDPAHTSAPRSEFWNDGQNSYFGPAWAAHDIGVCEEWLPFCPPGQADRDGNFFTINDCEPAPSVSLASSHPQGGTIIAEWKSAAIDPIPMRSGAPLPVAAATVSLQVTLAPGWDLLEWQGECADFPRGQPCQITTAIGKTSYAVSARLAPECPRGTLRNDQLICVEAPPDVKCLQAKWQTVGVGQTATECQIPNYDPVADSQAESCSLTPGGDGTLPGCDQIFGATLAFPLNPTPEADPNANENIYVYNCDPDETRGLLPATANTVAAPNCQCADPEKTIAGTDSFVQTADQMTIFTSSACVDPAAKNAATNCADNFWDLSAENGGKCLLPLSQGGTLSLSGCFLSGGHYPQCDQIFPVDNVGLAFPFAPLENPTPYVFNCGPGKFPQVNANDETECVGGTDAVINTGVYACDQANWNSDSAGDGKCEISTSLRGTVAAETECYFSGASQPQCADIFGPELNFPDKPSDDPPPAYAYNCDPDGTSGLLPATFADGKTSCECSGLGKSVDDSGVCVCSAGETASPVNDFCVADTILDGVSKCENAGWPLGRHVDVIGGEIFECVVPAVDVANSRGYTTCEFKELSPHVVNCADIFTEDFDFPTRQEVARHYFYNCDPDGDSGLLPATFATGETESCKCPSGLTYAGGMRLSSASTGLTTPYGGACVSAEVSEDLEKCHDAGWDVSATVLVSDSRAGKCEIPLAKGPESATVFAGCFVGGESEPQCADVFGAGLSIPTAGVVEVTFAFNCGATMVPETINLNGATSCECALEDENAPGTCLCGGGRTLSGDSCVCPSDGTVHDLGEACVPTAAADSAAGEVFGGLADDELCARFGGMALDEGNGRVCGGLDEAGTFCILDSAGDDPAFPCRGLFKHLRRCNGLHNRPATNPFICGERCDNHARGRHCL